MDDPQQHAQQVLDFLKTLPPIEQARPITTSHAPVLVIPNVLNASWCRSLIDMYKADGGSPSGFMRQI